MSRHRPSGARMFVALPIPDEARDHLEEFLEVRRASGEFRWVLAEHFHLTLAFLPSVPERTLDDLGERLARAAQKRTAFDTAISGAGAFPSVIRARALWLGLDLDEFGVTEIDRLATGARAAANRAGIEVDGARFRPHITLARLRVPDDATPWIRVLATYEGPPWRADRIDLVESFLGQGPGGRPRYEIRDTYRLTDLTG